jgi:PBP1b-binding outer membrane lipoprotein LpoB
MKEIITCIALTLIFSSCSSIDRYFGIPEDNIIEEAAEDFIKMKTGLDVDLTTFSPEKK